MFRRIISFSISNPLIVGLGVIGLVVWGIVSLRSLPIDAVPDITNNQVQIVTRSPALAPQEVEKLITTPVELTMASIPGIRELRSISRFGLSVVTIVVDDDVDIYWARDQVDQRLKEVQQEIPPDAGTPMLAPVTTGLGEIYQYVVKAAPGYEDRYDLSKLRTLQDWIVRRRLLGTPGVADVSSFGGYLRQLEIAIDPFRLRSAQIDIDQVITALEENNASSGGAYIEHESGVRFIRTEGIARSAADVEEIVIRHSAGSAPILVRDVASVRDGHAIRYGAMTYNSSAETVGGIVLMLKGANSSEVIATVKDRIAEIQQSLPEGVIIEPFLDRTRLVNKAISTVSKNLIEGALIVIFVLVLLLGNMRAGIIVASVIPLSMLFAVSMMRLFGVSGNLMSLGALDFGLIVDGAVIIVEAVMHALTSRQALHADGVGIVREASVKIRRSAAFGEIIIMIVYVPILALVGIEGKMFRPMAETVIFAIAGAFLLSTTYVPMMSSLLLKPGLRTWPIADRIMDLVGRLYEPVQRFSLRRIPLVIGSTLGAFVVAVVLFLSMGGEFIPQLDEGDFAVEMRLATGQSLTSSIERAQQAAGILTARFPEVERVIGKIGTSEIPIDPMPMESGDLIVVLKDKSEWTSATSREELASVMQKALEEIPGTSFSFQQPIQMRFNELMTGARQDVVIKIFGENLDSLAALAERIGKLTSSVQGAEDVYVEPISGLPQVKIEIDRHSAGQLGIDVASINTAVRTAFAGEVVGQVHEEERRFDIVIRLDSAYRSSMEELAALLIRAQDGHMVPITQVARIDVVVGPNQMQREDAQRRISVGFNVRGRDVQSIVDELQNRINAQVELPPGYRITYGGQFENLAAASSRLMLAVPVAMLLILFLLYLTFSSATQALLIFSAVPLASIGGIAALVVRGMPFSISAGVGFIALFGVAVLNGIVLLAAFRSLHARGIESPLRVIITGTRERLRPVTMTALVASLGFLPMALSTGDGAEVQRPLATVVIGGLVTPTLLTMILLPILFLLADRRLQRRKKKSSVPIIALLGIALSSMAVSQPRAVSLDQALRLARENNPGLRIAALEVERSALQGRATRDVPPLQVMLMGGQYNSSSQDNNLTLTQSIPFPTKLTASSELASEQQRESEMRRILSQREVDHEVRMAYHRACLHRERMDLLMQMREMAQRMVEVATRKVEAGDVAPLERLTAETNLTEVAARWQQEQTQLRSAQGQLSLLCGSREELLPAYARVDPGTMPAEFDSVQSPVIDVLEQQLRVAEQAGNVASAQLWPDVTLGYYSQTLIGTPVSTTGAPVPATIGDRFQGFLVGLAVPLWFDPSLARKEQAQLDRKIAEQKLRQGASQVLTTLRTLRTSIDAAQQLVSVYATGGLRNAQLLLDNTRRAYELGDVSWNEVHTALRQVIETRTSEIDARFRLAELLSLYELYQGQ